MKRENIHVGMRVKVKRCSSLGDSVIGKYATVIAEPYDGFMGVYVKCFVDGDSDVYTFSINSIKCSDEQPVVGDRVFVVKTGQERFFRAGSSGIVQGRICDGFLVKFDSGDYQSCSDNVWAVDSDPSKIAIIRNVEGLK